MDKNKKEGIHEEQKSSMQDIFIFGSAKLPMNQFTIREQHIAMLLLYAKSRTEISEILELSENTVKTHVQNIYAKAEVKNQKKFMAKYLFGDNDG